MTGKVEEKEKGSTGRRGDHDVGALTSPLPPLPLPLLPLRIKSGAIKCKSGQTAPPQLVGEFVLKWKWGWWRTWRLAPRLTWKERKRQLLIFSFDLWLPLVFHTNVDLWRSLTARCYWRDYRKRKREKRGREKKKEADPLDSHYLGWFTSSFCFYICPLYSTSCVLLLLSHISVHSPLFPPAARLSGFQTLYLSSSLFVVCFCLQLSFILSTPVSSASIHCQTRIYSSEVCARDSSLQSHTRLKLSLLAGLV